MGNQVTLFIIRVNISFIELLINISFFLFFLQVSYSSTTLCFKVSQFMGDIGKIRLSFTSFSFHNIKSRPIKKNHSSTIHEQKKKEYSSFTTHKLWEKIIQP